MRDTKEQVTAWMNLQQVNRVLEGLLEHRVRAAADLSLPEYEALFRLNVASDHPLQMSEIASQLINSPSGMTRIVDRLEKDGLIARETPPDNRRVVLVKLTPRGRSVLGDAEKAFRGALNESFAAHLSEADLTELRRLMRKLLESNGAWTDARCSPGATPGTS
ncbi:MAG TPA: MarR family transcriptional regulator [Candidatus Limnocylindrales bacterium]|nr:MarR family transcriptional regulator [Candidatus Limnocylindrales bacterium]